MWPMPKANYGRSPSNAYVLPFGEGHEGWKFSFKSNLKLTFADFSISVQTSWMSGWTLQKGPNGEPPIQSAWTSRPKHDGRPHPGIVQHGSGYFKIKYKFKCKLSQKLSMELLGTVGNTPGPTAAKAQLLYDQQLREMHDNNGPRKRNSNGNGGIKMFDTANRKIEDLECKICNKTIMSRIRGFHILWHLNNDLGIVRYGCKFCNFKHDRPQSVVAHGGRDHGVEDCCEDLLYVGEFTRIFLTFFCRISKMNSNRCRKHVLVLNDFSRRKFVDELKW